MTDERIVEVIAETIYNEQFHGWDAAEGAELVLAALRDAGFDVYRPDDCETVCAHLDYNDFGMPYLCGHDTEEEVHHEVHGHKPEMVRLVPVGGDSSSGGPVCGGPSDWHKECDPSCWVVGQ